ncbi:MAG TPA: hypothetical protein VM557_07830 [Thermoanaerobaculia bacterium]|nr:hypothetical protein [Thermoanaerobaculia bacterium]
MQSPMKITVIDREFALRERLSGRLEQTALLRCGEHGEPVIAVTIHNRENGWFDSSWTTCCEALEQQAAAIVKQRC